MATRNVYLVASTGFPNYGDELVAAQWLRYLAVHEPDATIWLDSPSPGNSQLLLGHLHPDVRFVDTLFQIAWAGQSNEPWEVVDFAMRAVRHPGVVPRRAAGVDLLHSVDVFHVLGGGYINTLWPRHLTLLAAGAVLSTAFDARSAMTGHGLVPSAASGALLDRLTSDYHVVDVRDSASRNLLSSPHVTESGDDVLLGLGPQLFDARESRSVMVCVQSDLADAGVSALAETVVATLGKWGVNGSQVGYVEAMPGADRRVFDLVEPFVPDMRFYPFTEIWREGLPARRGQRWLTTRLHPHLVAAAAGAWGVAIPVSGDYDGRNHESLFERGSRWGSVVPGEAASEHNGEAGFGSALAGLTAGKEAVADKIYRS